MASYDLSLDDEELDFQRLYGPWDAWSPRQAREIFDPLGVEWWIAGGWAIEAFTGVSRHHEDIDVSMFRRDLPLLRQAFRGRFHLWAAGSGALSPLEDPERDIPDSADQVWLRAHALAPWRADVVLNPSRDGRWVSRRDPTYDAQLEDITFTREGIRYLKPEIALSFKAALARPKDEADLAACLPLLDGGAKAFLADYLARIEPDHSWRHQL